MTRENVPVGNKCWMNGLDYTKLYIADCETSSHSL